MKYLVIALLSSPLLLAYQLRPEEMRHALGQILRSLLELITR